MPSFRLFNPTGTRNYSKQHRVQRSYFWWQAKRKFYSRSHESPLFTVESTMNLTYQTVMPSCYNLVKYYLILVGNECRPKGNAFGKRRFPSEARSAEKKKRPGMKLNTTWLIQCGPRLTGTSETEVKVNCRVKQVLSTVTNLKIQTPVDCSQSPIFSWDCWDIGRLTVNDGHLDFQMHRGGAWR